MFLSEWCCCLLLPHHPFLPSVGVTPGHTSFSMHALLVDHYVQGAFYPRGGSSEIAFHTIPVIQRAGGAVLTRATVQSVLLDSAGKACGESPTSCFTDPGLGWERPAVQRKESTEGRRCRRTDFLMGVFKGWNLPQSRARGERLVWR